MSATASGSQARRFFSSLVAAFASYGLACLVFIFLFVLTFVGTWDQKDLGLYECQKRYFESFIYVKKLWILPLAFPGGYLLMTLLGLNLLFAACLKIRKSWRNVGMFIVHGGVLFLLFGSFVAYHYSFEAQMGLTRGETSNVARSLHEWELAIVDVGGDQSNTEYVIPMAKLLAAVPVLKGNNWTEKPLTLKSKELPFDVTIDAYYPNAEPRLYAQGLKSAPVTPLINDEFGQQVFAFPREPEKEQMENYPCAVVTLLDHQSGLKRKTLLWGSSFRPDPKDPENFEKGGQSLPWTLESSGKLWDIWLRRKQFNLPFSVRLDEFRAEFYPNTSTPKSFESDVAHLAEGAEEKLTIRMNEPMRREGYTFYQAHYDLSKPNNPVSVFAVVRNPADQIPLYSCSLIALGLLIHFWGKLLAFLRKERGRAA